MNRRSSRICVRNSLKQVPQDGYLRESPSRYSLKNPFKGFLEASQRSLKGYRSRIPEILEGIPLKEFPYIRDDFKDSFKEFLGGILQGIFEGIPSRDHLKDSFEEFSEEHFEELCKESSREVSKDLCEEIFKVE